MNRRFPFNWCVLAVALLAIPAAHAQEEAPAADDSEASTPADPERTGSFITIVGGSEAAMPLALPDFKLDSGLDRPGAETLRAVVVRDLTLSGYFQMMDRAAFIEPVTAGVAPGEFGFDEWRLPGAVALVKVAIEGEGDAITARAHIYNVEAGQQLAARNVAGIPTDLTTLGHTLANLVIEALTGTRGIFHTRVVAVANYGRGKEVYVFDYDGQNPRPVSRNGSINLSPAWSPDGTRVSYTSYRDNNPDLWITDLRSNRHTKVSSFPGINAGAEWSPDGAELALTLSKDGDSEIYALQPDGSIIRRLTRQFGIDVSPTYSPDGSTICFVSSRNGTPQLFLADRDGENVRRLTKRGGHNVAPAFSPDGRTIAFAGRDEGRFDIFVVDADGGGLKRLTQTSYDDEDPTWSPDGNHILFTSAREGAGKQLYIMTADGSNQTRLTDGKGSYSNPQWGPDPLGPRSFE
ncbi:MAG: Tol-Pal system beta propeller repeat protein TolB [Deltaproteobacteria bacterium]|nr:Tol-Pal system beta propeller repeat protein TolB [Deltaproteobacteria bacterium]